MRPWTKPLLALALAAAACGEPPKNVDPPASPPIEGQSEFETPTQGGAGGRQNAGESDAAAPGAPSPEDKAPSQDGSQAPERLIEESDIFKLDGTTLYVLNRYRGLQIFDISNLSAPRMIGRAPIFGWPREMYVRGSNAYVIVSDYYTYWRSADAAESPYGFHGSQVRVVDISNKAAPTVVGGIDVEGDVIDSRIVGEVLYLVSNRYGWWYRDGSDDWANKTVILSVDIADAANVHQVDSVDFPQNGWEHHISVTPKTIYVAAASWNSGWNDYRTNIRYVDISDPAGDIRLRGEASVPGRVMDRWSMDEWEGTLRVASGQSWGNGDVFLTTLDVRNPDALTRAGGYTLRVNERLTSARFDGRYGYLVSYRNIDPLFSFDLANPAQPVLLGELEMSGWLDFMVPMGDRIVALGHEDVTTPEGGREISLAVSLIDVAPGRAPTLLSRVKVGEGWGWVPGDRDDFAKVFKVLGPEGLILFPFQTWSHTDWQYVGGVQLIDYSRNALTKRGLIRNCGWVERGIPYQDDKVLTLSSEVLQALDITDRDNPALLSRLELARNVQEFAALDQTHAVQLSGDWYMGNGQLSVTTLADPDTATPLAKLNLPAPNGRLFMNGKLGYLATVRANAAGTRVTHVQVVDFTNALQPRLRGSVELPEAVSPGYRYWYWGSGDETVQVNRTTLAFHRYQWGYWWDDCYRCGPGDTTDNSHKVYFVDLANPDAPRLASTVEIDDVQWVWGLKARGNTVYLSDYRTIQRGDRWYNRYYLRRLDVSNPAAPRELAPVNIPGTFVDASNDGRYVYTFENWWASGSNRNENRIHALELAGDRAYLRSSAALDGWVNNVMFENGVAYTTTQWSGEVTRPNGTKYWTSRTSLVGIDVSDPARIHVAGTAALPVDWGWLQKVQDGRAFIGSGPGVFTFIVADPAAMRFEHFQRTQGWSQDIVVANNRGYVPSGYYGVQIVDLPPVQRQ